jgi:hypothetical protein
LYIATCTSLLVHRDLYIQEYQYYSVPSVVPTPVVLDQVFCLKLNDGVVHA